MASQQQSGQTLQSSTVAQAVANAKQLAAQAATGPGKQHRPQSAAAATKQQQHQAAVRGQHRPQGGTLGELLKMGVNSNGDYGDNDGDYNNGGSVYLVEVGRLAGWTFSDAILGYSWMNDKHWVHFPKPTSRKRKSS